MEPVASVVERIKEVAKSSELFLTGAFNRCFISSNHNPIDILKRLQREAFSDLMKLRDRQDKFERMLSFHKSGKGSPFQEASTHMKGIVDVVGALMFVKNDDQQAFNTLKRAGLRTGIDLRFTFETAIRQKDVLIAEFVASQNNLANHDNLFACPLALEKVLYLANIRDWLSVVTSPLGARVSEFGSGSSFSQVQHLGRLSSFMPPLFGQYHTCGAGVLVKGTEIAASLAELVSEAGGFSTFWQVAYQPFEETRLTCSGLWQMPTRSLSQPFKLGTLAIPLGHLKSQPNSSNIQEQASPSATPRQAGSIALMLESQLDECTTISGWVEMQRLNLALLQWGVSLSDTPGDELGWGLRMGGKVEGHFSQFQLEGFLNFDLGKKVSLQPGILYAMDGRTRTPALVFRSSWLM